MTKINASALIIAAFASLATFSMTVATSPFAVLAA